MTGFVLPPLVVNYDTRWIEVDLRGDLGAWAQRAARNATAREESRARARDEAALATLLEGAGALARRARDACLAFLLYPGAAEGVTAVVSFCPVDLARRDGRDAWTRMLGPLLARRPGQAPPEVTGLLSGAGPCRRVRQRFGAADGGHPPREHVGYVWTFPEYRAGVVMTTAFTDLLEAGRWRPVLDALATGVELDGVPGRDRQDQRDRQDRQDRQDRRDQLYRKDQQDREDQRDRQDPPHRWGTRDRSG